MVISCHYIKSNCFFLNLNKEHKINHDENIYTSTTTTTSKNKLNSLVFSLKSNSYEIYDDATIKKHKLISKKFPRNVYNSNSNNNFDNKNQLKVNNTKNYLENNDDFKSFIKGYYANKQNDNLNNTKSNQQHQNSNNNNNNIDSNSNYYNKPLIGECKLGKMEISLKIKNCGRIIVNTTGCSGLCKSSEQIIANTNLKRRNCAACKPHKFVDVTYTIKCVDNSIKYFTLKTINACTCFKHSETILPLNEAN